MPVSAERSLYYGYAHPAYPYYGYPYRPYGYYGYGWPTKEQWLNENDDENSTLKDNFGADHIQMFRH
jgi:hypothetical protein